MSNSVQLVLCNPTIGREDEFNRWYSAGHLPRVLQVPGILAGQRFNKATESPWFSGNHQYLTIWEIDDPSFALKALAEARNSFLTISDAIDMTTILPPTMWVRSVVNSSSHQVRESATRGVLLLVLFNPLESSRDTIQQRILAGAAPALADTPGVSRVEFLTLGEEQIRNRARKFQYALLLELANEAVALENLRSPIDRIATLPGADATGLIATIFRPLARRITAPKTSA